MMANGAKMSTQSRMGMVSHGASMRWILLRAAREAGPRWAFRRRLRA